MRLLSTLSINFEMRAKHAVFWVGGFDFVARCQGPNIAFCLGKLSYDKFCDRVNTV